MPRTENEIMSAIVDVYNGLSPENLSRDGEAKNSEIKSRSQALYLELGKLEKELGREVSYEQSEKWYNKNILKIA